MMSHLKRGSLTLSKAEKRFTNLEAIDAQLDLGNNLTLTAFEQDIAGVRRLLTEFLGVAAKFGKDSLAYKKAGGTPKSERKRPTRATPTETIGV